MPVRWYRYTLYSLLCLLGACAAEPEFEADRSHWETLFADANSCHGSTCTRGNARQSSQNSQSSMNVMNSSRR
jgi:hypothetical protein